MGNSVEKDVWWVWNKSTRKWQQSGRLAGVFLSENVAEVYRKCKEWFLENTEDSKLAKVRADKMDSILKRLRDHDKHIILKQAAEVFESCWVRVCRLSLIVPPGQAMYVPTSGTIPSGSPN